VIIINEVVKPISPAFLYLYQLRNKLELSEKTVLKSNM